MQFYIYIKMTEIQSFKVSIVQLRTLVDSSKSNGPSRQNKIINPFWICFFLQDEKGCQVSMFPG